VDPGVLTTSAGASPSSCDVDVAPLGTLAVELKLKFAVEPGVVPSESGGRAVYGVGRL
jgi:hypothetical protein